MLHSGFLAHFEEISSFFGQNMILGLPVKNEENDMCGGDEKDKKMKKMTCAGEILAR